LSGGVCPCWYNDKSIIGALGDHFLGWHREH
jgi:hypothetical protein